MQQKLDKVKATYRINKETFEKLSNVSFLIKETKGDIVNKALDKYLNELIGLYGLSEMLKKL